MKARVPVRSAGGKVAVRVQPRTVVVCLALLAAGVAVTLLTLFAVGAPMTVGGIWDVVRGEGTRRNLFVLRELRGPRLALAVLVGAAFAMSGAVFQTLSRNPLGSPDIIGFTHGSATGAIIAILFLHLGTAGTAAAAIIGAVVTALVVYLLATLADKRASRLVLVGIGVAAMLISVNTFLVSRARLEAAQAAAIWMTGTLNNRNWNQVWLVGVALIVLVPPLVALARRLPLLELGEDMAQALGLPVGRTRITLVLIGVGLCAVATAAAGPVAFVALAAPQIARRLTGAAQPQLLPAALTGAVLMLASDFLAQWLLEPSQLPVGVVTGAVGGIYLAWLLSREWTKGRGA